MKKINGAIRKQINITPEQIAYLELINVKQISDDPKVPRLNLSGSIIAAVEFYKEHFRKVYPDLDELVAERVKADVISDDE